MQSKYLLLAVAAFAVTATGVNAYGGTKAFTRAGLSEDQVDAIEEAQELRSNGDFIAARDTLVEAGITEETLRSIRQAAKESRSAMHEALEEDDYEAFIAAVKDSPLGDIITTEADFIQFKEAHELKRAGEREKAEEMLEELGIEPKDKPRHGHHGKRHHHFTTELTDEQRDALRMARQSNDKETVEAILEEAGVERFGRGW
jgi:hypothetical protein